MKLDSGQSDGRAVYRSALKEFRPRERDPGCMRASCTVDPRDLSISSDAKRMTRVPKARVPLLPARDLIPLQKAFLFLPISAVAPALFLLGHEQFAATDVFYRRLNRRELTCITTLSFLHSPHHHSAIRPPPLPKPEADSVIFALSTTTKHRTTSIDIVLQA